LVKVTPSFVLSPPLSPPIARKADDAAMVLMKRRGSGRYAAVMPSCERTRGGAMADGEFMLELSDSLLARDRDVVDATDDAALGFRQVDERGRRRSTWSNCGVGHTQVVAQLAYSLQSLPSLRVLELVPCLKCARRAWQLEDEWRRSR
jgi:hypothetical protein